MFLDIMFLDILPKRWRHMPAAIYFIKALP